MIGVEQPDGGYWMALFVALDGDGALDDDARAAIVEAIRTAASPRHVPDEVVQVPAIPRTLTGKKLEVPIKRLFMGADPETDAQPQRGRRPGGARRLRGAGGADQRPKRRSLSSTSAVSTRSSAARPSATR